MKDMGSQKVPTWGKAQPFPRPSEAAAFDNGDEGPQESNIKVSMHCHPTLIPGRPSDTRNFAAINATQPRNSAKTAVAWWMLR